MSERLALAQPRRIPAPHLFALGFAAAVIAVVVGIRGFGALNNPLFHVDVEALDVATGDVRWELSEDSNNHPSFGTDLLFIPLDGDTVAIDDTGNVRWRLAGFEAVSTKGAGDLIYLLGTSPSETVAVDKRSGEIRWRAAGWLVAVGDPFAIVRSGSLTEVVVAGSGHAVHVERDVREPTAGGQVVAFFVKRTLHILRPESDVAWEVPDPQWRNVVAVVDPVVVVSSKADVPDAESGGWQQVVAGYDSRTGEVRWEATVPAFRGGADVDGSILRLRRRSDVMQIDVLTGEMLPTLSAADAARLQSTQAGAERGAIVERFERTDDGFTSLMLLRAGLHDRTESSAIAVDTGTGAVVWAIVGVVPVAGNADVVATHDAASFRFLDTQTGRELGAIPASRKSGAAAASEQWVSVLAAEALIAVDTAGQSHIVAEGLSSTARMEGAAGDIVVVHERKLLSDSSARKRFLTAYDVASRRQLWQHQIPAGGSVTVTDRAVVVAKGGSITQISLRTGEIEESEGVAPAEDAEPSSFVIAAFDPEFRRLLWSHELGGDEHVAIVGGVALIIEVTRTNR